ncbi:MAG: tetratricopeptide repeat protein [Jaaginema sp. PMC 1079.18]|nr:tetratricopeptide repeat protein [Jaaginema sp. PMC 1080.18]MEC4851822.1 tetratricopeptide repeat protein [Jaaginema sp. PMC 1079.18]MEC4867778.1 tetratricopeptide repeat protein [Jaaginema sp. PMC 1078.18]
MSDNIPPVDLQFLSQEKLQNICYDSAGQLVIASSTDTEIIPNLRTPTIQEKAHLRLAFYWLKCYKPEEDASIIDQIRGYIEAFYHFCQLSAWSVAWQVLQMPVFTGKKLYEQFRDWGYYREQVEIYSQLFGKIDAKTDCILYYQIGYAHYHLGEKETARQYFQKQLDLAQQIDDQSLEALAWGRLGAVDALSDRSSRAIIYYQKQLEIASLVDDKVSIIGAWENLGLVQNNSINFEKVHFYLNKALSVAREYGDSEIVNRILFHIAHIHTMQGKTRKAILLFEKQLVFAKNQKNTDLENKILTNLANCYAITKQLNRALICIKNSLQICQDCNYCFQKIYTLNSAGLLHAYYLKDYHQGLKYFRESIAIAPEFSSIYIKSITYSNIAYCYGYLKQIQKAKLYAKKAIVLARKINHKEAEAVGLSMIANACWQSGKRILGIVIALKALSIIPPWKSANGRLLFQKIKEALWEIPQKLLQKIK